MNRLEQWSHSENCIDGLYLSTDPAIGAMCLAPGMRHSEHHINTYRFPEVPQTLFAEQLTRMDMVTS